MRSWQIKPFGDRALLIRISGPLNLEANQFVHQLWAEIQQLPLENLHYGIPSNLDLTLVFNRPIDLPPIRQQLEQRIQNVLDHPISTFGKRLRIPVCYDPRLGLDLMELSTRLQLSPDRLIKLHQSQAYQVFSMGFLPGFAYLGLLPDALQVPRKAAPRSNVPKGSVAIAAQQTGIYPQASPGGWHIIGQTPVPVFNPEWHDPFLFAPGDQVQFEAIEFSSFLEIAKQVEISTFKWSSLYA
ncbi:MAG: 5-oxoprolinase subunit PxpB [Bacteroidota bacterium]